MKFRFMTSHITVSMEIRVLFNVHSDRVKSALFGFFLGVYGVSSNYSSLSFDVCFCCLISSVICDVTPAFLMDLPVVLALFRAAL